MVILVELRGPGGGSGGGQGTRRRRCRDLEDDRRGAGTDGVQ